MYLSLKGSLGHTPITDRVGENLLQIAEGASAAYSLRNLGSDSPAVVRVRRESDNNERDFTAQDISTSVLTNWVNEQITPPLDLRELTATGRDGPIIEAAAAYSLRNLSDSYTGSVVDVRRSSDGNTESFTAAEVADGTLENWVLGDAASLVGDAQYFNGVDAYVTIPDSVDFDITDTLSVSARVQHSGIAPEVAAIIVSKYDTTTNNREWALLYQSTGEIRVFLAQAGTAGNIWESTDAFDIGVDRRLSFQYDGGTSLKVFSDGVEISGSFTFGSLPSSLFASSADVLIGSYNQGARPFNGTVRDVEIHNNATESSLVAAYTGLGNDPWVDTIGTNDGTPSNLVTFTGQGFDGTVSKWYDQSTTSGVPNAKNAVQTDAASQPKIVDGGTLATDANGKPEMVFDGLNDWLDLGVNQLGNTEFFAGAADSWFTTAVANYNVGTLISKAAISNSNREFQIFYELGKNSVGVRGVFTDFSADAGRRLISFNWDGSNAVAGANGASTTVNVGSAVKTNQNINIGSRTNGAFPLNGSIQEIIVYDSDQTDNRTALEANIGEVYGIAGIPAYEDTVNGFVETWYDQSGNGNDASQLTASYQPKIVSAGALVQEGGNASLEFDGVDDYLVTTQGYIVEISQNPASVFAVANPDALSEGYLLTEGDSFPTYSSSFILNGSGSVGPSTVWVNTTRFGSGFPASLTLGGFIYNGTNFQAYLNGAADGASGTADINAETSIQSYIGTRADGTTEFFAGKVSEIITYKSDQSANRPAIEANINNQYDIYS